jgi:ADP-heptose:LPS heptosyltransferase
VRILVVKPTALGDVAQALGIAPLLKQGMGETVHVTWLVDEDYAPVVHCSPWVDEIITFPRRRLRRQGSPLAWSGWLSSLKIYEFDVVLDLQGLARSALMTRAVRAKRRIGLQSAREFSWLAYDERVPDSQSHAVDRYVAAARYINKNANGETLPLPAPQGVLPDGLQEGRYTVLHPYSLWETKLWPWRNYGELLSLLPNEQFVMVGHGPFFPVKAPNLLDLRNKTDLAQLLLLLGKSRAMISTDSGPLHLAAAFGKPLLALFGATDPGRTAPRSGRVTVLTVDLDCRPCLRRKCERQQAMECLQTIRPQQVASAWEQLVQ